MQKHLMVAVGLMIHAIQPTLACTDSTDPETVVQAQLDAYNAHDVDRFVECYSDDVSVTDLTGARPPIQGKAQLREAYGFLEQVPDEFRAVADNRMVNGPIVVDHERVVGRGEGLPDLKVFAIYEVRDGKITRVWFPPAE